MSDSVAVEPFTVAFGRTNQTCWGLQVAPQPIASRRPLPLRDFVITRDDNGDVIVGDPAGAAYGIGPTIGEAFQQWEEQARQHYQDLRQEADALHPRMVRQLHYLTQLFG